MGYINLTRWWRFLRKEWDKQSDGMRNGVSCVSLVERGERVQGETRRVRLTLINIVTGTDVKEINKAFGDSARQGRCLVPAGSCAAFETDGSCSRVGGVNDEVSKQDESPPSRQHTTRRMHHTHYVSVWTLCVCVLP